MSQGNHEAYAALDRIMEERFANDLELFQSVVELFIEQYPEMLENLVRALKSDKPSDLAFAAHKLKGTLSVFHCLDLTEMLAQMESAALSCGQLGSLEDLRTVTEAVKQVHLEISTYLKDRSTQSA